MSAVPYPISGIIYDSDSEVLNGVTVSVINTDSNEELTTTTNSSGEYILDLANLTSGYRNGDLISIYSSYGRRYSEQFHTVVTSTGYGTKNLTLSTIISSSAIYCSVKDIRDFTNVSSGEYSDAQLYLMTKMATNSIDDETGRTWKGIQTITNEVYDGDGTDTLSLDQTDVQSITALSIDTVGDGTYTAVSSSNTQTSSGCFVYHDYIILDAKANIPSFRAGVQSVKISYTYGNASAPENIRLVAILIVSNMMKQNAVYAKTISEEIKKNKRKVRLS